MRTCRSKIVRYQLWSKVWGQKNLEELSLEVSDLNPDASKVFLFFNDISEDFLFPVVSTNGGTSKNRDQVGCTLWQIAPWWRIKKKWTNFSKKKSRLRSSYMMWRGHNLGMSLQVDASSSFLAYLIEEDYFVVRPWAFLGEIFLSISLSFFLSFLLYLHSFSDFLTFKMQPLSAATSADGFEFSIVEMPNFLDIFVLTL